MVRELRTLFRLSLAHHFPPLLNILALRTVLCNHLFCGVKQPMLPTCAKSERSEKV